MRAAIYARMSTDKQSADSPADQISRCRDFATLRGWHVVDDFVVEDAGISGASRHNRPQLLQLVAHIDEWDVLLCYDFSRLARDSEDLGWIRNRLRLHKRTAYESSSGLDVFNVGSKVLGIINEEFLVKLRADTHRGLRGRVERGFSGGGMPYGYRSDPIHSGRVDHRGAPKPDGYKIRIEEKRAAVVLGIFEQYAGGAGVRAIAHSLNAAGVEPPRARRALPKGKRNDGWAPSALHALLRNRIYIGDCIWNRSEWIKDHETGKRRRHERPEIEWLQRHDEALRIVPDELWQRVHTSAAGRSGAVERRGDGTIMRSRPHPANRTVSKHLLSGLLECALCGGAVFVLDSRGSYGCSWRRDRGPSVCVNPVTVPHAELEGGLLRAFREQVLTSENVGYVVERALGIVQAALGQDDRESAPRLIAEASAQIARLVRLAESAGNVEEIGERIAALRLERDRLARQIEAPRRKPLDSGQLRERIQGELASVHEWLAAPSSGGRDVLRSLLGGQRMRFGPDAELTVRVEGAFELHLDLRGGGEPSSRAGAGGFGRVVAGTGFEPVTFGL